MQQRCDSDPHVGKAVAMTQLQLSVSGMLGWGWGVAAIPTLLLLELKYFDL